MNEPQKPDQQENLLVEGHVFAGLFFAILLIALILRYWP